jgi:hypothetical protein
MDITVGVIIFLVAFISIFALINSSQKNDLGRVQEESEYVLGQMKAQNSPVQVIMDKELNDTRLKDLSDIPYEQLKNEIGIREDFCIYLEAEDGTVLPIDGLRGIGSSRINISGTPCG